MKLGIHITYGYTVTDKYFQNFRSKVKVVGRRKVKKRYLAISRERTNTYNFCIWHFGLCVIVSKIDRCRSSDPPYKIAINPWWRGGRGLPSLIALLLLYQYTQVCYNFCTFCLVNKLKKKKNIYISCDDPWEYMCFRVTLVIMVLLYVGHSVWPDPLPGQ